MKSSSTTGLSFSFIPDNTSIQNTLASVDSFAKEIVKSGNTFYLFSGTMPDEETLAAYKNGSNLEADYASNLILKMQNIDIKYTFDKKTKTRKIQKMPINAQSYASAIDGSATWACIELAAIPITSTYKCLLFTDAVGGWDDPEQSILVSSTTVVAGENIVIKDINITLRDSLLID